MLHGKGVHLVEFTATWCPPCRALAPVLEAISREYQGRVSVRLVNVDSDPELAERYNVRAMPTMLVFKEGLVVEQLVGAAPKRVIESKLQRALA